MSLNPSLPHFQRDVAEIYAAPDHATLVALYESLVGEFDATDPDLSDSDDLRQHLIDFMSECCHAAGIHAIEAGVHAPNERLPRYIVEHFNFPHMAEAHELLDAGWCDVSEGNDACPRFESPDRTLRMWIQHPLAEAREPANAPRFALFVIDGEGNSTSVYSGDKWPTNMAVMGGTITADAPAIPVGEVLEEPSARDEAVANADAYLQDVGLPTFTAMQQSHGEVLAMLNDLDAYLREIRAENLDGSEPALGELLDHSLALRTALGE